MSQQGRLTFVFHTLNMCYFFFLPVNHPSSPGDHLRRHGGDQVPEVPQETRIESQTVKKSAEERRGERR